MAKEKGKPGSATGRLSHHDEPALVDGLVRTDFIEVVSGIIRDCTPPKGLAISGYWGSGKTSALMQIHLRLCGKAPGGGITPAAERDPAIVPVWFEAWRYQHEALPIVALLNEIREQLGLWEKFKEEAKKIGELTAGGILYAFEAAIKAASAGLFAPKVDKLRAVGTQWEAERYQQPCPAIPCAGSWRAPSKRRSRAPATMQTSSSSSSMISTAATLLRPYACSRASRCF